MDFRTTYGTLLKEQLEMYARMLELLDRIATYDTPCTSSNNSNVYTKSRTALQKQRLTLQLEKTYDEACQSMERIENMSIMCQQILSHPVYMQLLEIHIYTQSRINEITSKGYSV